MGGWDSMGFRAREKVGVDGLGYLEVLFENEN